MRSIRSQLVEKNVLGVVEGVLGGLYIAKLSDFLVCKK